MKKTNLVLGALAMILASALVFTGCNTEPEEPAVTTYTVTFNPDNEEKVTSVKVNEGETVTAPESPVKEGYDFEAWYNGETAYDFETAVSEDFTLTAKWTIKKLTVTFDVNGGTGDVAAQTVEYGAKATAPETNPTFEGKNFIAWTTTKDDADTTFDFDTVIKADVTLYAYYSSDPYYTVKFMNGETVVSTKSVKEGSKTTAPEDIVKTGYTFEGWFADTTKFDAEAAVTANVTYTAKFSIETYTITYVLDDGTNYEDAPTTYTIETDTITLGIPTKEGYVFENWCSDAELATMVDKIEKGSSGNKTLYAKFIKAATGDGKSDSDPAAITKTTLMGTPSEGVVSIYYKGISTAINVGDRIYYEFTISGASNYKQITIQGNETNYAWPSQNNWADSGTADGTTLCFTREATKAIEAGNHAFKLYLGNQVTESSSEGTFTITNFSIKNYGKAEAGTVYEAFGSQSVVTLPYNADGTNHQVMIALPDLQFANNAKYKVVMKGKSNVDIKKLSGSEEDPTYFVTLEGVLIDNSGQGSNSWWKPKSGYTKLYGDDITANEEFEIEVIITATGDSYSTSGNLLVMYTKGIQTEDGVVDAEASAILTLDTFKIVNITPTVSE